MKLTPNKITIALLLGLFAVGAAFSDGVQNPSGNAAPTGAAGGDLSGTYPNPSVAKVAGVTPGTGVATALGVNVGTAGAFVVNGGALGTPSSGVGTNLTGTAAGLTAGSVSDAAVTNAKLANMANSTLKCRTTAGTGVPEDCTAAQAASIIGGVGGAVKSKIIQGTRLGATANSTVGYTGLGFQPTNCTVNAATTVLQHSWGMTDGSSQYVSALTVTTMTYNTSTLVWISDAAGANRNLGTLVSFDADGLSISWAKTGTPQDIQLFMNCKR